MSSSSTPVLSPVQKTLARSITCIGEGVHNGRKVVMEINPAPAGHGILFERTDVKARIPAKWDRVRVTPLCTQIINDDGIEVRTIEHIMAALYASGIDNAHIALDGPEVPIMDGSSLTFLGLIREAGIANSETPRRFIRIMKPVEARQGAAYARLTPGDSPVFHVTVAYPQHNVGEQSCHFDFEDGDFTADIASARTFGFKTDLEYLHANGLALGGNFSNAILIDSQGKPVNPGGYRAENELARHKLLDAVGDLALAGGVILGRMDSNRSGHALNNALLRALFADATAFMWVEKSLAGVPVPVADGHVSATI
jgi:UDP-3-O-[3-hydroxymyristoyl] N-acetylglucosamine deacetylase